MCLIDLILNRSLKEMAIKLTSAMKFRLQAVNSKRLLFF